MAESPNASPPPLPARTASTKSTGLECDATPYSPLSIDSNTPRYLSPTASACSSCLPTPGREKLSPYLGGINDPRASSTQSLRPVESGHGRRTLLIVYIHGFLGSETSFKSFPAHVHGLLTPALAESHLVYTKIYPRYKSRKNISFARDDFSNWLTPHESDETDVILVGHSLGGILAAEVALLESHSLARNDVLHHRILGIVAFDTPFLGMHPGVVGTGIASLFRSPAPAPEPADTAASSTVVEPFPPASDHTYNPAYANDVLLARRKGKLQKAWYFWNKHAGELTKATGNYLQSHLEFGGCLADYPGLRKRYSAVRSLEDIDEFQKPRAPNGKLRTRVRFVNYYSASTGRIKEREPEQEGTDGAQLEPPPAETQFLPTNESPSRDAETSLVPPPSPSPRLSLEEYRDGEVVTKSLNELKIDLDPSVPSQEMQFVSPEPISEPEAETDVATTSIGSRDELVFPPLPDLPDKPGQFDPSNFTNEGTLKLAKREHANLVKAYERAVRDRQRAIRDRDRLVQKREREVAKTVEKEERFARIEETRLEKERLKRAATVNADDYDRHLRNEALSQDRPRKQKDRKFCALPFKDPRTGMRDPTWIRVYMEGIDEVAAHTSMFNMGETYAKMVADTAERVENWVKDDMTKRLLLAEMK